MKTERNFVLISDIYGMVHEKIPAVSNDFIEKGENILKIISSQSHMLFFDFFKEVKEENYVKGCQLELILHGKKADYSVYGFLKDEKIYISFFAAEDQAMEVLTEIIKINNMQINELRKRYKEQAQEKARIEEDIYIEITKLNSELLNSKRTIEKQNAKLSEYNKILEEMAMKDPLTGAYNRRYFYERTPEIAEKAALENKRMFFASLDLNYFKKLNDRYGHDFGDKMLKALVSLSKTYSGSQDLVFRIGGDEFLIVFIEKTEEQIHKIMEDIEAGYKELTDISTISYGLVEIDLLKDKRLNTRKMDMYLKKADRLMYNHKAKVKSYI